MNKMIVNIKHNGTMIGNKNYSIHQNKYKKK